MIHKPRHAIKHTVGQVQTAHGSGNRPGPRSRGLLIPSTCLKQEGSSTTTKCKPPKGKPTGKNVAAVQKQQLKRGSTHTHTHKHRSHSPMKTKQADLSQDPLHKLYKLPVLLSDSWQSACASASGLGMLLNDWITDWWFEVCRGPSLLQSIIIWVLDSNVWLLVPLIGKGLDCCLTFSFEMIIATHYMSAKHSALRWIARHKTSC